jgi:hypothetical protein
VVTRLLALALGLGREVLFVEAAHDPGEVGGAVGDVSARCAWAAKACSARSITGRGKRRKVLTN